MLLNDGSEHFLSYSTGSWCTGNNCAEDFGTTHTWSASSVAVPEPASMTIFGTALIGFAMTRRRRG